MQIKRNLKKSTTRVIDTTPSRDLDSKISENDSVKNFSCEHIHEINQKQARNTGKLKYSETPAKMNIQATQNPLEIRQITVITEENENHS